MKTRFLSSTLLPFLNFGVPLLKETRRRKGALIIKGTTQKPRKKWASTVLFCSLGLSPVFRILVCRALAFGVCLGMQVTTRIDSVSGRSSIGGLESIRSKYPNSRGLGSPKIHTLNGFLDPETLLFGHLGPLGESYPKGSMYSYRTFFRYFEAQNIAIPSNPTSSTIEALIIRIGFGGVYSTISIIRNYGGLNN